MSLEPCRPPHDEPPFWQVTAVYDPDGEGGDFAYTVGLFTRGLPELHVWGRPSLGDDPGLDWKLSQQDCCMLLNELGSMLGRGELSVGSTLCREYDGGLAVLDLRVDPPEDKEYLEALGVPPGVDVLPVRWSLTRAPEGPPLTGLAPEAEQRAQGRYVQLVAGVVPGTALLPPGWELPEEPSFEPGQRFGPLTPLVLARAAQLTTASTDVLEDFAYRCHLVRQTANLSWPRVRARGLGRPAGRRRPLDALETGVDELVAHWQRHPVLRRRWRAVVDRFCAPHGPDASAVRQQVEWNVQDLVTSGVSSCLAGEAVADVADEELSLWAAGPWEGAAAASGFPGPRWYAAEPVVACVRDQLSELTWDTMVEVGLAHLHETRAWSDGPGPGTYACLRDQLYVRALVSAAGCPPVTDLLPQRPGFPPLAVLLAVAQADCGEPVRSGLNDWLNCLTAVLVHRAEFTEDQVATFVAPVQAWLPGLRAAVDAPL